MFHDKIPLEETENEWYQNLYESTPRELWNGRLKNIRTHMDIINYSLDNEQFYLPYDELWDFHLENPLIDHVKLLEMLIAEKTPITEKEKGIPQYWSIHPKLGIIAHFQRGNEYKDIPIHRITSSLQPKTIDFKNDFSIQYKGSIVMIDNIHPCPYPTTALIHGTQKLLDYLELLETNNWKVIIKENSPLLIGHKDAIDKIINDGNMMNSYVYELSYIDTLVEGVQT